MKRIIAAPLLFIFFHSNAQIVLKGYNCRYFPDQMPNTIAEMYNGNDTFRFTLYSRDIWGEEDGKKASPAEDLKIGLKLCFDNLPYTKTKDGLYICTGKGDSYYYVVYVPEQMVTLSIRSGLCDEDFNEKSKWLLAEVRSNRRNKKDMYFINEKNQTCQDPDEYPHK